VIHKIVSGGQTGADRAALDWAILHGISHGGWCPRGRRAEDGVIDPGYLLEETPSPRHYERTHWNVRDSDATIIFSLAPELFGGSLTTAKIAQRLGKPWFHFHAGLPHEDLAEFLRSAAPHVLNIAGPRRSHARGIEEFVKTSLDCLSSDAASGEPLFEALRL
jgi:Circularly permutated YpsA SLOG family